MTFEEMMRSGNFLVLDGAMGTELELRKVPMSDTAWSAAAAHTHPKVVSEIHADFIRAGADIITTNSFATTRFVLEPLGLGAETPAIVRACVECARRAMREIGREALIAGSTSPMAPGLDPSSRPRPQAARSAFREVFDVLADEGVDLLLLEMLRDTEFAGVLIEEAKATGLPVCAGLTLVRGQEDRLVMRPDEREGLAAEEVIPVLAAMTPDVMAIMHTDLHDTPEALALLGRFWSGPIAVYPHSGRFNMPHWDFSEVCPPEEFARESRKWISAGATIIGGCCGIGPDHIRHLSRTLQQIASHDLT